jgi:hypothetical protein
VQQPWRWGTGIFANAKRTVLNSIYVSPNEKEMGNTLMKVQEEATRDDINKNLLFGEQIVDKQGSLRTLKRVQI